MRKWTGNIMKNTNAYFYLTGPSRLPKLPKSSARLPREMSIMQDTRNEGNSAATGVEGNQNEDHPGPRRDLFREQTHNLHHGHVPLNPACKTLTSSVNSCRVSRGR